MKSFLRARRFLPALLFVLPACAVVQRVGVGLLSRRASLPESQIRRDLPYVSGGGSAQSLDLYLPTAAGGPVMVFVHGGGWDTGDKSLRVGGLDVYGNIGRFYASRGIATAVINYRLMPSVGWREQRDDVADAARWVRRNAARFGYDADRLYFMGHSAGGQLAADVALNGAILRAADIPLSSVRGLVVASGAALDLLDDQTYRTEDPRYYERRFGKRAEGDDWAQASPIGQIDPSDPATLVLFATGESKGLQRQAHVFYEALTAHGVPARLLPVHGESHQRMVLVLSHPGKPAAPEIAKFILGGGVS